MNEAKKRKLTGKQKTFVAEYISNGKNATQAALKAYPDVTYNTARYTGSTNLAKPNINEAISAALAKSEATPEYSVLGIKRVADMELDSKTAPSVLKAHKELLALHGWNAHDKPQMNVQFNQFFGKFGDSSSTS